MNDKKDASLYHRFCSSAGNAGMSTPRELVDKAYQRVNAEKLEGNSNRFGSNAHSGVKELPRVNFKVARDGQAVNACRQAPRTMCTSQKQPQSHRMRNFNTDSNRQVGGTVSGASKPQKCYHCTDVITKTTCCVPINEEHPSTSRQAAYNSATAAAAMPFDNSGNRCCCAAAQQQEQQQPAVPTTKTDLLWNQSKLNMHSYAKTSSSGSNNEVNNNCSNSNAEELKKCCAEIDNLNAQGDAMAMNDQINELFLQRLEQIDCEGNNDTDLKLITYQEWVEILLRINSIVLKNMKEFEEEIASRLKALTRKAFNVENTEAANYRKDICLLIKFIQNAYQNDCWNIERVPFLTLDSNQILYGLKRYQAPHNEMFPPQSRHMPQTSSYQTAGLARGEGMDKFHENMKALTREVNDRHDQMKALKDRVYCLEKEIQMAQQKIQLKDDYIRELTNDLKKLTPSAKTDSNKMQDQTTAEESMTIEAPLVVATAVCSDKNYYPLSYSRDESRLGEHLNALQLEMKQLFVHKNDAPSEEEKQQMKLISMQLREVYKQLDNLIQTKYNTKLPPLEETVALKADTAVSDSGFDSKTDDKSEDIKSMRFRLLQMQVTVNDSQRKAQQLELEKEEIFNDLKARQGIHTRSEEVLKQIADKLSTVTGNQLCYEHIYREKCQTNPFIDFIDDILRFHERAMNEMNLKLQNKNQAVVEMESMRAMNIQNLAKFETLCVMNENLKSQNGVLQKTLSEKDACMSHMNNLLARMQTQLEAQSNYNCCHATSPQMSANKKEVIELRTELEFNNKRMEKLLVELGECRQKEHFQAQEIRKMHAELHDSRRSVAELTSQNSNVKALWQQQEKMRKELTEKCKRLEASYEEHDQNLRAAHAQMRHLNEKFIAMEQAESEHLQERKRLREEMLFLKGKEAELIGRHQSYKQQLHKYEKDLSVANRVIADQRNLMQRNSVVHASNLKKVHESHEATKRTLQQLGAAYRKLQTDLHESRMLAERQDRIIVSYRTLKEAQAEAEKNTREALEQYEEQVRYPKS